MALAQEAIVELEPLGDELALARAWWLRSSGDLAACRFRARGEAIERALEHARRARAGVETIGVLAGLHAQALLYGPTPVDEAIARVEGLAEELDLDATLRGSVHTSLAGLLALSGDLDGARRMFKDAAATYEEFGLRFRRATQSFVGAQIELLAGDIEAAEWQLRASVGGTPRDRGRHVGDDPPGAPRRRRGKARRRGGRGAGRAGRRTRPCPMTSSHRSCGAARSPAFARAKARRRRRSRSRPRPRSYWQRPSSRSSVIAALTAGAEVAAAANDGAEAERLLAEARKVAESKGAVASLAQVDAGRVAG